MMNAVKFCVVFLGMPTPSRALAEYAAAVEATMHRGVVCLVASDAEPLKPDLCELTNVFEMFPVPTCDELILTKEVRHEVTRTHGTKPANPQPRRYVGAWDCRWG